MKKISKILAVCLVIMTLFCAVAITSSAMKVKLLADVEGRGKAGDVIEVSEGYARNFLFPKKLAEQVDDPVLDEKSTKDEALAFHKEQELIAAKKLAESLNGKSVTIEANVYPNDRLGIPVTNKIVADAIEDKYDVSIDKRKIEMPEIKKVGKYDIKINVYTGVVAKMIVEVIPKGDTTASVLSAGNIAVLAGVGCFAVIYAIVLLRKKKKQ